MSISFSQINADLHFSHYHLNDDQKYILKSSPRLKRIIYRKKTIIIKEGEELKNIYFLTKGFVKVYRDINDKRIFFKLVKPGEFIGINLFSTYKSYPYSLATVDDCILYEIPRSMISKEIYKNQRLMQSIINNLMEWINELNMIICFQRCKHMNGRVAEALLYFANHIFKSDTFIMPITRKQLGHFSNVSTENVSRILINFEKEKIISFRGKELKIQNKQNLAQISKLG